MRKTYFLVTLIVLSLLVLSLVTAFWPFTGRASKSNVVCSDSDADAKDKGIYTAGTTTLTENSQITQTDTDICSSDILAEYSCKKDAIVKKEVKCKFGCNDNNNACATETESPKERTCIDTDLGVNASVAGIVKFTKKGKAADVLKDACTNKTLIEKFCTAKNKAKEAKIKCKTDCEAETVIYAGTDYPAYSCEPLYRCKDSDLGKNTTVQGTVSIFDENGTFLYNVTDFCRDDNKVVELGCSRKTCEGGKDFYIPGFPHVEFVLDSIFGEDEECSWAFAPSSAVYRRIHLKVIKCKKGSCLDGKCIQESEEVE